MRRAGLRLQIARNGCNGLAQGRFDNAKRPFLYRTRRFACAQLVCEVAFREDGE